MYPQKDGKLSGATTVKVSQAQPAAPRRLQAGRSQSNG